MATLEQILDVLNRLRAAYPHYHPREPRAALNMYIARLSRFSQSVLQQAAEEILDELKFFPSVSELVQAARRAEAQTRRQRPWDTLAEQRLALEDACWMRGHFARAEWEALAEEFKHHGREYGAAALLEKATTIENISFY
jgi:hypothetical protein